MTEKRLPFFPVIMKDGDEDRGQNDRVIERCGGQHEDIVDQPKRYVAGKTDAADPGSLLHDAERKKANRNHRDKIKGTRRDGGADKADDRDRNKARHKRKREPQGKGDLFIIEDKAHRRLHRGEDHDTARGHRAADDALQSEQGVG